MTLDDKLEILHDSIKSLENIAAAHQAALEAHDDRIESLVTATENLKIVTERQGQQIADLSREWQAYLRRIPPQ